MNFRWLLLLSVVMWTGCAQEKRLGESFIESRRYRHGWHVQARHDAPRQQPREVQSSLAPRDGELSASVHVSEADFTVGLGKPNAMKTSLEASKALIALVETSATQPQPQHKRQPPARLTPRQACTLVGPVVAPSALRVTEVLPEPIEGRHPASVPGFVLSLGWLFGLIGEAAVGYLQMPLSGVPIVAGLIASIAVFILSRKAYRASLEHPDLYPRYRLSKAGRILSFAPLAPIALYVGIVLLVVLVLGIL